MLYILLILVWNLFLIADFFGKLSIIWDMGGRRYLLVLKDWSCCNTGGVSKSTDSSYLVSSFAIMVLLP